MVSQVTLYLIEGKLSLITTVNGDQTRRTDYGENAASEIIKFLSETDGPKSLTLQQYGHESYQLTDHRCLEVRHQT